MYAYRTMSPRQRQDVLDVRRLLGHPLHAPPHYPDGCKLYLITAACFEHRPVMDSALRRAWFEQALHERFPDELRAWVVLPNHYHLLVHAELKELGERLRKLHSAASTRWNKEDRKPGRQVWYRFSDRAIRGDAHAWATMNYIHANPVKHGYADKASQWPTSSLNRYLDAWGREEVVALWHRYPVDDYGRGWDD